MTVRRTAARSLLLVAPFVLVSTFVGAQSAFAATGASFDASAPADGAAFTGADSSVTVSATLPACPRATLGGCASTTTATMTLASAHGQSQPSVSKTSTTGQQTLTQTVPAGLANDVWTVTLTGNASRTFSINQANVPVSFSADGSGARDVAFAWNKGEADISAYVLADSNGTVIDDAITPANANCASSPRCSYGLYYPSDNAGNHGYQLVAKRPGASSGSVTSGAATANATLTAPPKPSPSAAPSASAGPGGGPAPTPGSSGNPAGGGAGSGTTGSGTTGSGSSSGSTSGGGGSIPTGTQPTLPPGATNTVVASRRAFALTFNAFSPSLGIPKLPPLPATDLPSIGEQPLPFGTYKPSLPYQGETKTTTERSLLSSPTAFVQTFTDSAGLAKSIAAALLLLLVGAHLRRFLGTHLEE